MQTKIHKLITNKQTNSNTHKNIKPTSGTSLTNVFKVKDKFKAMHKSTVMPSLKVIA